MSTCNVEILNFFNPELRLQDTESKTTNKLKHLLTELKGFKFVITLVLKFKKKKENDHETKYSTFYLSSKASIITNESDIGDVSESSIVRLYQTYKNQLKKVLVRLLIQS